MIMRKLIVGPFSSNSYILGCEKTKQGLIIDPGDEGERIISTVNEVGVKIIKLLHTHAHYDHVGATLSLKKRFPDAEVSLHKDDQSLYYELPLQARLFGFQAENPPKIEHFLTNGEKITFGNFSLKVIHTPGHSPGGVSFLLIENNQIFTGDTLFYRSIGRTDLWGGNYEKLINSIKDKLFILDNNVKVFPGHGEETTIGDEKRENPFL